MNAQGIPILYLSLDQKTALDEVNSSERQFASVASFRVEDSFPVLDLTKLESIRRDSTPFSASGALFFAYPGARKCLRSSEYRRDPCLFRQQKRKTCTAERAAI